MSGSGPMIVKGASNRVTNVSRPTQDQDPTVSWQDCATYSDFGMPRDLPGTDKVVFGQVENEDGFRVMAYDIPGQDDTDITVTAGSTHRENGATITDRAFFQSVRAEDLGEITGYWNGLAAGGSVIEPLAASSWTPGFGMLTDRFGVTWVLDVQAPDAG